MRSWWSKYYSRPLKDPLLESYTLEELLYEYFDIIKRKEAEEEEAKAINDKIEDEKLDATLKWAEEDERLEAELAAQEEMLKNSLGDKQEPQNEQSEQKNEPNEEVYPEEINSDFSDL